VDSDFERQERNEKRATIVGQIVAIPVGIALLIWTVLITVTAFIGGQAPLFFVDFDGFNLIRGLLWLIVVDPIVLTVAYWIYMLIMLPVVGLIVVTSRRGK
jgi:hypothetical protein